MTGHPAKFSEPVLDAIRVRLDGFDPSRSWRILDPFAGVGGVHRLGRWSVASELEPEWAVQAVPRSLVADARTLPFPAGAFDAVVTSPTFANRMSDSYDGAGVCRACQGSGSAGMFSPDDPCRRCGGGGRDRSSRSTYRISLGRPLAAGNSGGMQWGRPYRDLHRAAWSEAARVLAPGGVAFVDVKDHFRDRQRVPVTAFHVDTLTAAGLPVVAQIPVRTRGYGHGRNRELRTEGQTVLVCRKDAV